jgi:hypothetical protein
MNSNNIVSYMGEVSIGGKILLPISKFMDKQHIFVHLQYLDEHFVFNISLVFAIT